MSLPRSLRTADQEPAGRPRVTTSRERLADLLDALPDDQIETVLSFVAALSRRQAVVSACDVADDNATPLEASRS